MPVGIGDAGFDVIRNFGGTSFASVVAMNAPSWGGLGGLTHENQQVTGSHRDEEEEADINEGGVGGSMLPHTDGCK